MDWLESHRSINNCLNKTFTCIDDEGRDRTIKGIPMPIIVRKISSLQLKKCASKGCKLFSIQMIDFEAKCNKPSLEDFVVLR